MKTHRNARTTCSEAGGSCPDTSMGRDDPIPACLLEPPAGQAPEEEHGWLDCTHHLHRLVCAVGGGHSHAGTVRGRPWGESQTERHLSVMKCEMFREGCLETSKGIKELGIKRPSSRGSQHPRKCPKGGDRSLKMAS